MFSNAYSFNGDISSWNVSGATDTSHMFSNAYSFNGDISSWNVSGVTDMSGMFAGAFSFDQNLGDWYIVLDNTFTDIRNDVKNIWNIAAQNPTLDSQNPAYGIGSGADSILFTIDGDALTIKPSTDCPYKTEYAVNVTSTGDFGTNNFRMINVTVAGACDARSP